jgi:hypothetical protein
MGCRSGAQFPYGWRGGRIRPSWQQRNEANDRGFDARLLQSALRECRE